MVISMPDGFRGHLVGKTLVNVFQCDIAEFIQHDKSSPLNSTHMPRYTHKMATIS